MQARTLGTDETSQAINLRGPTPDCESYGHRKGPTETPGRLRAETGQIAGAVNLMRIGLQQFPELGLFYAVILRHSARAAERYCLKTERRFR